MRDSSVAAASPAGFERLARHLWCTVRLSGSSRRRCLNNGRQGCGLSHRCTGGRLWSVCGRCSFFKLFSTRTLALQADFNQLLGILALTAYSKIQRRHAQPAQGDLQRRARFPARLQPHPCRRAGRRWARRERRPAIIPERSRPGAARSRPTTIPRRTRRRFSAAPSPRWTVLVRRSTRT